MRYKIQGVPRSKKEIESDISPNKFRNKDKNRRQLMARMTMGFKEESKGTELVAVAIFCCPLLAYVYMLQNFDMKFSAWFQSLDEEVQMIPYYLIAIIGFAIYRYLSRKSRSEKAPMKHDFSEELDSMDDEGNVIAKENTTARENTEKTDS